MIAKPLIPIILDANNDEVARLDPVVFPILQWTESTATYSQVVDTSAPVDISGFATITAEYDKLGGAVPDYWSESWYLSKLSKVAPLSIRRQTVQYSGYKIKLLNAQSGYYAISSGTIGTQGSYTGNYNLYTNGDELIGSNISATTYCFPLYNSVGVATLLGRLDDTGSIVNIYARGANIYGANESSDNITLRATNRFSLDAAFIIWYNALKSPAPGPSGDDPFNPGGTSEAGGGDGTYGNNRFGDGIDDESIEIPDYDGLDEYNRSLRGTGFVNIYTPSRTELQSFANYLWSTPSISDVLKRMYSNPFDAVISLHMVPVTVTGSAGNIYIGGQDSGIASTRAGFQYTTVSCGSLKIGEFWAAYLDYSPYTKLYVYLPFCGMHEVDADEFMGKTMSIRYDVDIVTGDCLASISASDGLLSRVLYQYQGNCAVEIPVSGQNYNAKVSAYMGLIGTAFGIGAGVASGGMSAAAGVGAALAGALNTVNAKGSIQRSGALSGSTAWMSCLKPYIILVQPTQCLPDGQNSFTGYPSFMTAAVGDLSGYTEFEEIHLAGISATDEEKAEIERIMKEGVLL